MATYRIGIGTEFKLDGGVGIGTDTAPSGLGNLKVEGTFKTEDLDTTSGIATFTRYAGFAPDNLGIDKDTTLTGEHQTTSDIVVGVNSTFTVSTGATVCTSSVESISLTDHFSPPCGGVEDREECPVEGTVRFNKDLNTLEFYNGVDWRQFTVSGARGRGVYVGGSNYPVGPFSSTIDYIEIATQGNALDFGDLAAEKAQPGPGATETRGLFTGGMTPSATNQIEYITIPSGGNGIDFGDLTRSSNAPGGASSSTRMLSAGGQTPGGASNVIDYFEMHTLGNAIDFGDLTRSNYPAGVQSPTRAVFGGGYTPNGENKSIEFSIFASLGNTTSFGDLTQSRGNPSSGGNSTRGLYAAGWGGPASMLTSIEQITIASEGNASPFGDLKSKISEQMGACSNSVRCVFSGGNNSGQVPQNVMEFVIIATTGNSQDFGDLIKARRGPSSLSDSHGGLGGF